MEKVNGMKGKKLLNTSLIAMLALSTIAILGSTTVSAEETPAKPISIYTDKYSYSAGDIMRLGLDITNPLDRAITVGIAIWLERPVGPIILILFVPAVTLPAGFTYSNPNFVAFMLPSIPSGIYTWHAAFLNPITFKILVEDTAEWRFI